MQGIRTITLLTILLFSKAAYSKAIYYSFKRQCKLATEIFVGRVIEIRDSTYKLKQPFYGITQLTTTIVKVKLIHTWKGQPNQTMTFRFTNLIACCGNRFSNNTDFIVYMADKDVDFCSGRTEVLNKNKDLRRLNIKYRGRKYRKS
jgi:hypothetical protein